MSKIKVKNISNRKLYLQLGVIEVGCEGFATIAEVQTHTAAIKEVAEPAEAKPAEAEPAEAKPAEAKPAEAKPAKPAEAKK